MLRNGTSDIVALNPKDLNVKDSYSVPGSAQVSGTAVFEWQGREVVAAYGDGLVLLDGKNVGEVQAVAADGLAVSKTSTGTLWLYAASRTGSIVAFTVENKGNHPVLQTLLEFAAARFGCARSGEWDYLPPVCALGPHGAIRTRCVDRATALFEWEYGRVAYP